MYRKKHEVTSQKSIGHLVAMNPIPIPKPQMPVDWVSGRGINYIFAEMQKHYQNKWLSQFADENHIREMKYEWTLDLKNRCMEQVEAALELCRRHLKWPPNSREFCQLCIDTGLAPAPQSAYRHAKIRNWPHPAVYAAFNRTGGEYAFNSQPDEETKKIFMENYAQILSEKSEKDLGNPYEVQKINNIENSAPIPSKIAATLLPYQAAADVSSGVETTPDGAKFITIRGCGFTKRIQIKKSPEQEAADQEKKILDKKEAEERRLRLIRTSDLEAPFLPHRDQVDRMFFLRDIEAEAHARRLQMQNGNFNFATGEIK